MDEEPEDERTETGSFSGGPLGPDPISAVVEPEGEADPEGERTPEPEGEADPEADPDASIKENRGVESAVSQSKEIDPLHSPLVFPAGPAKEARAVERRTASLLASKLNRRLQRDVRDRAQQDGLGGRL